MDFYGMLQALFCLVVVLIFSIAIYLLLPVEFISSQAHILTSFIYGVHQVTYFFG